MVPELGGGDFQLSQNLLGVLQEDGPVGGEGDRAGGPAEEPGVQLLLQGADLPGDGGLGDVQGLRRPGEVQMLRHLDEALQLLYIQAQSPLIHAFFSSIIPFFHFYFNIKHALILRWNVRTPFSQKQEKNGAKTGRRARGAASP